MFVHEYVCNINKHTYMLDQKCDVRIDENYTNIIPITTLSHGSDAPYPHTFLHYAGVDTMDAVFATAALWFLCLWLAAQPDESD